MAARCRDVTRTGPAWHDRKREIPREIAENLGGMEDASRARMGTPILVCFFVLGIAACGRIADVPDATDPSTEAGTPSSGGTSGSVTTTASDAAVPPHDAGASTNVRAGRCLKDGDCDPAGHCVELAPGGYRVCSYPPPAPEVCTNDPSSQDECCGTCAVGVCTLQTSCGGAFIMPRNVCAMSACSTNADCGGGAICLPTGVGSPYARTCMPAGECVRHSDCTAAADGVCALVGTVGPLSVCGPWGCPGGASTQSANGLACIYGGECAGDEDCAKAGGHCEKVGGRPACRSGLRNVCPPPP